MSDVFISYVEEDSGVALEIARGLEAAGYTTWYYERDSQVGSLYLLQVGQAIERSRAVVLIISSDSLASNQVTNEVVRAYESDKPFLPVLRGITHPEFQQRQTLWRQALGATVAINLPPQGVPAILPRLIDGLRALGIQPKSKEEREAEAREQERAKKLVGLLTKAGEARSAEKWDQAMGLLKEALELAPNDEAVQGRLRGVQEQQRESQLNALRARARSLAEGEEWDEALSTWREYLALDPKDREAAETEIQQVEKLREMAHAYAQAQAAMAEKDYERATGLLQSLIIQDPAYKDAARLLAKAVELRRTGGPPQPSRWLWGAVATVALVAVALVVTQVLPRLAPSGQETTPVFTQAVADATAVGLAVDVTPILPGTEAAIVAAQVELAPTATPTSSLQQSKPETATPTRSVEPTTRLPTPTAALASTATPAQAATPVPSPVGTVPPPPTPLPRAEDAISPENAEQVVQLARWGKGTVNEIAYSPDGALLAVASSLGVYLYDSETLSEVRFMETEQAVESLSFAPDGTLLVMVFNGGSVQLWTVVDGKPLQTLQEQNVQSSVAFSPDGKLLITASEDGKVQLWGVADGVVQNTFEGDPSHSRLLGFSPGMAVSPDGGMLALAGKSGQGIVRLFRVADGKLLAALQGHTSGVSTLAFSSDGKALVSGSYDDSIRLYRTDDGAQLLTLDGHADDVLSVVFAPNGKTVASGSADKTVRLWQVVDGALLGTYEGHTGTVQSVAFSPDGNTLASGSTEDGTVRLWRVTDGVLLSALPMHTNSVRSVAFAPDGKTLASGSDDSKVRLWRVTDGESLRTLEGHTDTVNSVAFSPDGATLASASGDKTVRLWRTVDGEQVRTLEGHTGSVNSVTFSPDGQMVASGSTDTTVRLWQVADGTSSVSLQGHESAVASIAFSPDGRILASASAEHPDSVRLWATLDWVLLRTLGHYAQDSLSVIFSPNGSMLAVGFTSLIALGDPADVKFQAGLSGHERGAVPSIAFLPSGNLLASASSDSTVRLWDTTEATLLRTLEGHTYAVNSVAVSPDGGTLASGSSDGTIRLWGVVR